jgi:hypothetical protein
MKAVADEVAEPLMMSEFRRTGGDQDYRNNREQNPTNGDWHLHDVIVLRITRNWGQ